MDLKQGLHLALNIVLLQQQKKSNMRLLSVVMGVETSDLRSKDTTNLLNYGFNTYKLEMIMKKSKVLGNVKIEKGKIDNVDLVLTSDATLLKK